MKIHKKAKKHSPIIALGVRRMKIDELVGQLAGNFTCAEILASCIRITAGAGESFRLQAMLEAALKAHIREMNNKS